MHRCDAIWRCTTRQKLLYFLYSCAEVAELADAHDSGSCGRKSVEVQVLSSASRNVNELQNLSTTAIPHPNPAPGKCCVQPGCSSFFEFQRDMAVNVEGNGHRTVAKHRLDGLG